jgi:hypothetical protein
MLALQRLALDSTAAPDNSSRNAALGDDGFKATTN